MIDINDLRKQPEAYQKACELKNIKFDVQAFLKLDQNWKELTKRSEELRSELNALSKAVPQLTGEKKEEQLKVLKELSEKSKNATQDLKDIEEDWKRQQLLIPAIPLPSVPVGKDDSENVELKKWGEIPQFKFKFKDHVKLGLDLDILEIERGVKIAGSRNYFLKGDGARLHHAVLAYARDFISKRGYTLMEPPHIVKYEAMAGTGYFPGGEDMAYHLDERDGDSYLIGTSEVPLVSYHMNELFSVEDLPKRYAGYSPCYRREAGTYGKDTQGLYRVHQFYKVEQIVFCEADEKVSEAFHQELLSNSEEFLQSLNIPYRVVAVCTGDMGQGQVYKNDIEAWMPSRNNYGETHSCSTLLEFQSRRLNVRYKDAKSGTNKLCHTLNNTLVASPRILIPIIELNQTDQGEIMIPEVLRPYMANEAVICSGK